MKKRWVAGIVLMGCLLGLGAQAGEKPMNASIKQLDLDGNFLLFLKTDGIKQYILNYLDTITQVGAATPGVQGKIIQDGVTHIKSALDWSGLLSFTSYATSRAPTENGLIRHINITQFDPTQTDKPIWHIIEGEPRILKGIDYVPDNAVFVCDKSVNLTECWKTIEEAIITFTKPRAADEFQQKIALIEMMLGTKITAITDSNDHEIFLSVQYSKTKKISFPIGLTPVTIAEPSLLIGIKTKSPLLSSIIFKKLKAAGAPMTAIQQNNQTFHILNLPPNQTITIQPTLVQTKEWLLLGTNPTVIQNALDAATKKNGIASTPLYKKLLKDAPEKLSAIEFVSPELFKEYLNTLQKLMNQDPSMASVSKKIFQTYTDFYMGGYTVKRKSEIYSKYYTSQSGSKIPEMVSVGYVGILAAIALPSFQKARINTQKKMAINNARMIICATDQYAMEKALPSGAPIPLKTVISTYVKGGINALNIGNISPNLPKELKVDDPITPAQLAAILYPTLFPQKRK